MASQHVEQVLTGIKRLSLAEKKELAKALAENLGESPALESIVESTFVKAHSIHTSPVGSGGCTCCGK